MKKTSLVIIITGLILFSMLLVAASISDPAISANGTVSAEEQTAVPVPLYYVRVYNNSLAIYRPDESEPFEITDIHISSLREYDQKLMQSGFPLYSEQDLIMFLEDYGS